MPRCKEQVGFLDYHTPLCIHWREVMPATLLMLPAVCGFSLFWAAAVGNRLAWTIGTDVGAVVWITSILCSGISFIIFRHAEFWWQRLCVLLNWCGLVFTFASPGLVFFYLAMRDLVR